MKDTFRKQYAALTDAQKKNVELVKERAEYLLEFYDTCLVAPHEHNDTCRESCSDQQRCMAIARTNLEQSIMWAVKAITTAPEAKGE